MDPTGPEGKKGVVTPSSDKLPDHPFDSIPFNRLSYAPCDNDSQPRRWPSLFCDGESEVGKTYFPLSEIIFLRWRHSIAPVLCDVFAKLSSSRPDFASFSKIRASANAFFYGVGRFVSFLSLSLIDFATIFFPGAN